MGSPWDWITLLSSILTVVATVAMLLAFRRERRIGVGALLLSIAISLVALAAYAWISGARTSWIAGGAALALGLAVGVVRALTVRLSWRAGRVVVRGSWWLLLVWGLSYALAGGLNLFRSVLLTSLGLVLLCLSTGAQVGEGATLLLRRLFLPPPEAPPGVAPASAPPPPTTLPERS